MKNQKRGVSLIVLVITIIVIIILAAAVILTLNNNNPIANAKKATFQSDLKTYTDELSLYIANQYTNSTGTFNPIGINAQEEAMNQYISSMQAKYHNIVEIELGKLVIREDVTGDEKLWAEEILGYGKVGKVVESNMTIDGLTTGTATNPIIPKGFAPINTATSTWGTTDGVSKGLVIEDKTGDPETNENQFVWIPVPEFSNFKRQDWKNWSGTGEPADIDTSYKEEFGNGTASVTEVEKMYKSVKDNQGFYIARYEAGKPESGKTKAVSRAGRDVLNRINWTNSGLNSGAIYPELATNVGVISTLIYSVQWDAAMRWMKDIENTGNTTKLYIKDSTGMGNYSGGGGLKQTGATDVALVNNIFDLAGNVWEWTMETTSPTNSVARGGNYDDSGSDGPVLYRDSGASSSISNVLGFRPALYIKNKI